MLWVKSLHIIFMVTWFAGLFYLPRLFVYHAMADDSPSRERFKIMERKLYWGIMTPGGVLTLIFGVWLWLVWFRGAAGGVHAQGGLGALLAGYHPLGGMLPRGFPAHRKNKGHRWPRRVQQGRGGGPFSP